MLIIRHGWRLVPALRDRGLVSSCYRTVSTLISALSDSSLNKRQMTHASIQQRSSSRHAMLPLQMTMCELSSVAVSTPPLLDRLSTAIKQEDVQALVLCLQSADPALLSVNLLAQLVALTSPTSQVILDELFKRFLIHPSKTAELVETFMRFAGDDETILQTSLQALRMSSCLDHPEAQRALEQRILDYSNIHQSLELLMTMILLGLSPSTSLLQTLLERVVQLPAIDNVDAVFVLWGEFCQRGHGSSVGDMCLALLQRLTPSQLSLFWQFLPRLEQWSPNQLAQLLLTAVENRVTILQITSVLELVQSTKTKLDDALIQTLKVYIMTFPPSLHRDTALEHLHQVGFIEKPHNFFDLSSIQVPQDTNAVSTVSIDSNVNATRSLAHLPSSPLLSVPTSGLIVGQYDLLTFSYFGDGLLKGRSPLMFLKLYDSVAKEVAEDPVLSVDLAGRALELLGSNNCHVEFADLLEKTLQKHPLMSDYVWRLVEITMERLLARSFDDALGNIRDLLLQRKLRPPPQVTTLVAYAVAFRGRVGATLSCLRELKASALCQKVAKKSTETLKDGGSTLAAIWREYLQETENQPDPFFVNLILAFAVHHKVTFLVFTILLDLKGHQLENVDTNVKLRLLRMGPAMSPADGNRLMTLISIPSGSVLDVYGWDRMDSYVQNKLSSLRQQK